MLDDIKINKNLKVPYYYQLYEKLAENIENSSIPEGFKLSGEMDLCRAYGVSRITVRQALHELEINGYITRHRGKGTFIRNPIETHSLQKVSSIIDQLKIEGIETVNKILANKVIEPKPAIKKILKLEESDKILFVKRLVFAHGSPLYITKAYFPVEVTGKITDEVLSANSFTKIITEILDIKLVHSKRILEADMPEVEIEKLLGLNESAKKVINYLRTFWTVLYKAEEKLIYFEEFFNPVKGRFIFEKTY